MQAAIVGIQYQQGAMGGVENYLRQLLRAGSQLTGGDRMTLLGGVRNESILREMAKSCAYRTIHPSTLQMLRRAFIYAGCAVSGRNYLGQMEDVVALDDYDVVHYPFSVLLPRVRSSRSIKRIVTIHDLQHIEHPDFFPGAELLFREKEYRRAAGEADLVLTDSEYSRKVILASYRIEPERVQVLYPGIDVGYFRDVDDASAAVYPGTRGITGRYLLYPAAPWPHKNHDRLFRAIKNLINDGKFDGTLVLCGVFDSQRGQLDRLIEERGVGDCVKVFGYLPMEELRLLYRGATAMVYPSLYEGFGFPVLEAMAAGTPVVCSKSTSLPELGGDYVRYVDPTDVGSIVEGIHDAWSDRVKQENYRDMGGRQAGKFSETQMAMGLLGIYGSTLES